MTMEAKAREFIEEFCEVEGFDLERQTAIKYLTEAHNAGYESAWKPTEEWKRQAAEGEFNRGMKEAAKVRTKFIGSSLSEADIWQMAQDSMDRAIREKINDLPGTRETDSSAEAQGDAP